jgi:hypothetical protein
MDLGQLAMELLFGALEEGVVRQQERQVEQQTRQVEEAIRTTPESEHVQLLDANGEDAGTALRAGRDDDRTLVLITPNGPIAEPCLLVDPLETCRLPR